MNFRAGFHQDDIYKALHWLEDLAALQDTDNQAAITMCSNTSMRVFQPSKEISRINMECRGFLLFLEQINVLTTEIREMVIDRVMGLETNEFELDDLKWIILMVLFNVPVMKVLTRNGRAVVHQRARYLALIQAYHE